MEIHARQSPATELSLEADASTARHDPMTQFLVPPPGIDPTTHIALDYHAEILFFKCMLAW